MLGDRIRYGLIVRLRDRPRLAQRVLGFIRRLPLRSVRSRVCRWFSWLMLDDLPARLEVTTIAGTMVVDTEEMIGRVLAAGGEPHVTDAFRRLLRSGDICLDVGAHIGYYTLLASKLVGSQGHVYAFEPSPNTYRALTANIARNAATNVTALNLAAGRGHETAVLYAGPGSAGTSSLSPQMLESPDVDRAQDYSAVEVEVDALESLVPSEVFGRVRMIKLDVEGYEVEALRGLERILAEGARISVIVELSPKWSAEDPAEFVEGLCRRHGLSAFRLANEYSLDGFFPARIVPPAPLDEIPAERCDLLLMRGGA